MHTPLMVMLFCDHSVMLPFIITRKQFITDTSLCKYSIINRN